MPTYTLKPQSHSYNDFWVNTGGGSIGGAVSDGSDSSYITRTGTAKSTVTLNMDDLPSLAAGEVIESVRFHYRMHQSSTEPVNIQFSLATPNGFNVDVGTYFDQYTSLVQSVATNYEGVALTEAYVGGYLPLTPWTRDIINSSRVFIRDWAPNISAVFIYEISLIVETNMRPVPTGVAPNGPVTTTDRPVFAHSYADADNDPQRAYRYRLFTLEQSTASDFDPNTATPVLDSGELQGTDTSWPCPISLANGKQYRAYVQVYDGHNWSTMDASGPFAYASLMAETPAVPSITLTTTTDPPSAAVSIASMDNLLSIIGAGAEVDTSAFTATTNCTLSHPSSASPIEGSYLCRSTASSAGDMVISVDDKKIQVVEGLIYAGTVSLRPQASGSPQRVVNAAIRFFDEFGQTLSTVTGPDVKEMANSSGYWTQAVIPNAPAPLGARLATLRVTVKSAGNGEYHDIDRLSVTAGAINLVRNPTGVYDSDFDGQGDFWEDYNTGAGDIAYRFEHTTPLFDDAWSRFDISNSTNYAGTRQALSLPGSASGHYGYASCFLYSPNDCTVRLSVDQIGSTTVTLSAQTVTPVVVSGLLTDQDTSGVAMISIASPDQSAEVWWTGAQVGISPTALSSYDPELNVWPNNWTRGGIAGSSTHEIQRSDDGEKTWIDVRRIDDEAFYYGGLQTYELTDYELPPGNANVTYRARKVYIDSSGTAISSPWSKYKRIPNETTPDTFWLVSLTNASLSAPFDVELGMEVDREEPQGVYKMIGRSNPVVLRGKQSGESGKMTVECITRAEYDAFLALRATQETLWLVSPLGDGRYVALGSEAPATIDSDNFRTLQVSYREVDRPAVTINEAPTVVAAPITPTTPPATPYVGLLDDTTLPPFYAAYSVRALSAAAKTLNKAITITLNDVSHTVVDIGFDGSGNLDTAAITTAITAHSATSAVVTKWWDQTGNGFHLLCAEAKGWTIYASGSVIYPPIGAGTGTRPALRAADAARGMVATGASFTGNKAAAFVVGAIQSAATSLSPRFLSIGHATLADNDTGHSGAIMVARDGGSTVNQGYRIDRGSGPQATKSGTYNTLQQITSTAFDGVTGGYQLRVDGTAGTGATFTYGNFNVSRILFGHTGSVEQSVANQYASEMLLVVQQPTEAQMGTIAANQAAYFGTGTQTVPPSSTGTTLVTTDNLASQSLPLPSGEWLVYNNGNATQSGAAWMSRDVLKSGNTLILQGKKNTSPITVNGKQYLKECATVYWPGPSGLALASGGFWEVDMMMDGNSLGWGVLAMMWPVDEKTYPWATGREYDIIEIYSGNATKKGGQSYLHYDTVAGTNRQTIAPTSTSNSSSSDVAAGNYQVDWTGWHTVGFKWVRGSLLQVFVDGVSKATINGTSYNPVNPANQMRFGIQLEGYGTSDAATTSLFNVFAKNFRYSTIP